MKNVKVFDNKGKTFDRFMVIFTEHYEIITGEKFYQGLGMSTNPTASNGFLMEASVPMGNHLGKSIAFSRLPDECKQVVLKKLGKSSGKVR